MSTATSRPSGRRPNRLAGEASPYLQQHAHNPVDWYPWGEEAFARARAEDKPVFLSVGYATCHWCHVMERESFEDETIAQQLNEGFIAIKVDREELPDVDHVYMTALQALAGRGGWPMNMFLTTDLKPFFGGTYFAPEGRHGEPGFADVLRAVRTAWAERRGDVAEQAQMLTDHVRNMGATARPADTPDVHATAIAIFEKRFDARNGGFGSAPKFPQAPLLQYLLTLSTLPAAASATAAATAARAKEMLTHTLSQMAKGGIYDHVGGGFARYSTDARWHVPHFEKMLYDNAQLVRIYVGAWRLTGEPRLRFVAEDTLAWLAREMHPAAAAAAYSSAIDADSEGVEGRFYVWTATELREVLGADADAAIGLFGATETGNWNDPHGGVTGVNALERRDPEAVRAALGMSAEAFAAWDASVRDRLSVARAKRVRPITDDKVLADWNGLMLRALAEASRLLGRTDLVADAKSLARFLLTTMSPDGRLRHAWRDGRLRSESFLTDHAQVGLGLLELHAATGEPEWLQRAHDQATQLVERFHEAGAGFFDGEAGPLPIRARDFFDGAAPSGTAAASELLLRLAGIYDRADWREIALEAINRQSGLIAQAPEGAPALLMARLIAEEGSEIVVPVGAGAEALVAAVRSEFAPRATFVFGEPAVVPVLAGRNAGAAYLCRHGACGLPVRTIEELRAQIDAS